MRTDRLRIFGWLLVCVLLAACADQDMLPAGGGAPEQAVDGVRLRLALSKAGEEGTGETTPGIGIENAIHSLYVFVEESQEDGTVSTAYYPFKNISLVAGPDGTQTAEVKLPITTMPDADTKFYLGANLEDAQAKAFCNGNAAYSLPFTTVQDYNRIEALAPGVVTSGNTPRRDIAMFCTEGVSCTDDKITTDKNRTDIRMAFSLKRMVAKVLTTCREDLNNPGYAPLKGNLDGNQGWISLNDIHFLVNSLNCSTYIMEKFIDGSSEDPNNSLEEYLQDDGNGIYSYDGDKVAGDFVYASPNLQYQRIAYFKPVPKYEESKLPGGTGEQYQPEQVLYCTENLFAPVAADKASIFADYKYVWPMITHVSIAAKYTPGKLCIEKDLIAYVLGKIEEGTVDGKDGLKEALVQWQAEAEASEATLMDVVCGNEYISQTLLTESLKKTDAFQEGDYIGEKGKYPEQTYFYHKENGKYYTYGAALLSLGWTEGKEKPALGNYIPYTQGWGYYYTYINGTGVNGTNEKVTYDKGQVERNTYYILIINSFSSPGTSIDDGGYIDVHTRVEEWKPGGNGEITLE